MVHDILMYCSGGAIALAVFVMWKAYKYVEKAEEKDAEFYFQYEKHVKQTMKHEESIVDLTDSQRETVKEAGVFFEDMKYLTGDCNRISETINEHSRFIKKIRDLVQSRVSCKEEKNEEETVNSNNNEKEES